MLLIFLCLTACALPVSKTVNPGGGSTTLERMAPNAAQQEHAAITVNSNGDNLTGSLSTGLRHQLDTCLFEAQQLSHLGGAGYRHQIDELYRQLRAVKYYASIAGELSGGMKDTITPLYQYKINDLCNTISQSLLMELKKGNTPVRSDKA